jgi:hypothetical protein
METDYQITKTNNFAPNKTQIVQKKNSNILICEDTTESAIYQWGYYYRNNPQNETLITGDYMNYNYIQISHQIDTVQYEYFVDIKYGDNNICSTRTFYPSDVISTDLGSFLGSKIQTYPNPTKNNISILVEKDINDKFIISIKNTFGQTVYERHQSNYKAYELLNFDFNLPAGVYFLVIDSSVEVLTSKIVIE